MNFKLRQVPDYVTMGHTGTARKCIFAGLRSIASICSCLSVGIWWKFPSRVSSPDDDKCILCTRSGVGFHPIGYDIPEAIVVPISYKYRAIYKLYLLIYRFEMWTTAWYGFNVATASRITLTCRLRLPKCGPGQLSAHARASRWIPTL